MYLINISPTSILRNKKPYEAWYGYKPRVHHLQIFGSIIYALIPSNKLQKLDTKSKKCVFICYYSDTKAYRLFNLITSKVIVSGDVTFNEDAGWNWKLSSKIETTPFVIYEESSEESGNSPVEGNAASSVNIPAESNNSCGTQSGAIGEGSCGGEHDTSVESPARKIRSLAETYENYTFALNVTDPCTYEEVEEIEVWREVMNEELEAIRKNSTWELVEPSSEKKIVQLKWIYKTKFH